MYVLYCTCLPCHAVRTNAIRFGEFHESVRRGQNGACAKTGFCLGRKRLTLNTAWCQQHDCVAVFLKLKTPSNATSSEYSMNDRKQTHRYLLSPTKKVDNQRKKRPSIFGFDDSRVKFKRAAHPLVVSIFFHTPKGWGNGTCAVRRTLNFPLRTSLHHPSFAGDAICWELLYN